MLSRRAATRGFSWRCSGGVKLYVDDSAARTLCCLPGANPEVQLEAHRVGRVGAEHADVELILSDSFDHDIGSAPKVGRERRRRLRVA